MVSIIDVTPHRERDQSACTRYTLVPPNAGEALWLDKNPGQTYGHVLLKGGLIKEKEDLGGARQFRTSTYRVHGRGSMSQEMRD